AAYTDRIVTMRDGRIVSDEPVGHDDAVSAHRPAGPDLLARPSAERHTPLRFGASWAFALMVLAAAAQAIMRNKLRAVLTMLGVFIGVAALIAMVAVGQGANAAVEAQIASLGSNLLVVLPGVTTSSGVRAGFGSASTLTVPDAEAIESEDSAVAAVAYADRQVAQVTYGNQNWSTQIQGVTPSYLAVRNWSVIAGRAMTEE